MQQHLTRIEQANLIAGHAVSYATAYLDGRHTAQQLADNADRLFLDMLVVHTAETSAFLVPVQLLAVTMMQTARHARISPAGEEGRLDAQSIAAYERLDRWQSVMGSMVNLVLNESRNLTKDRA